MLMAAPPPPNDPGPSGPPTEPTAELLISAETSAALAADAARAYASSLVGRNLGDFEIVAELGRGGMGIVYKARQTSLDRLVALKLLPAAHFPDPVRLARFLREARAAASLSHPNIVQVYQVGECTAGH